MLQTESVDPLNPAPGGAAPAWREALAFWFRLGFISFGGPAGQIALMHRELVERRGWISERRFLHALNYCMVLPGPEAQQLATYLGWLMHRSAGGIAAGVLFVLPSLVILIALSAAYVAWGQQPLVAALFAGVKPAVTALVLQAAWRIGRRTLRNPVLVAVALAAFGALQAGAPFPLVVAAAALAGAVGGRVSPRHFALGGGHAPPAAATADPAGAPALIGDDTPTPPHARFRPGRLAAVLAAGALLWALALGGLVAWGGTGHTLVQMGRFFTQAALLSFGGAYAVLPYVHQGAVQQFGWLSAAQMLDGLALGETTPGPLIMVVAFVGYLGGHGAALFGPEQRLAAGAVAAVVVTFFTFLPSFIFILAGGPLVESSRGRPGWSAPLTAITAAVVGVILHLALFLAGHVLWPAGPAGGLDLQAALIGSVAALALLRWQVGVIPVIAASALAGGLLAWLVG